MEISNKEKANELAVYLMSEHLREKNGINQRKSIEKTLLEMAEWKDEQFSIEKKKLIKKCNEAVNTSHENGAVWMKERLIEKAAEWLEDMVCYYHHWEYNGDTYEKEIVVDVETLINDFKKDMGKMFEEE